ncbi:hypothetical protein D3C77_210900 [compost metagenome]
MLNESREGLITMEGNPDRDSVDEQPDHLLDPFHLGWPTGGDGTEDYILGSVVTA